ncbi:MAG: methyltransferase domain-containing protein [Candidatus Izemoplasma sp.]
MNIKSKILKCPICNRHLSKNDKENVFKCDNNHSFDIAKQGYINLLMSNQNKAKIHGDSSEMLNARKEILFGGYYYGISNLLNKTIKSELNDINKSYNILDIGTGVGYYVKQLKDKLSRSNMTYYGIDISKPGINVAAKLDKDINFIVGSNSNLPYLKNSIDLIISIFSPLDESECERVLKDNGKLIVISPNRNHLIEIKKVVYPSIIEKRIDRNELLSKKLIKIQSRLYKEVVNIPKKDLKNLLLMTPHYWKSSKENKENLYILDSLDVSIDIVLNVYQLN